VMLTNPSNSFNGSFAGDGGQLTNLAAASLVGALPSAQLAGSYSNAVMLSNPANEIAGRFEGDGSGLTNLDAANLTGTVPDAALIGIYSQQLQLSNPSNSFNGNFAGDGGQLTNLAAASLVGALPSAQLAGTYSSTVTFSNAANQFTGSFEGDGGGLTNLDTANLTGPLPDTALSGTYSQQLQFSNPSNSFNGNFVGDGGQLTNLVAASLVGALPSAQLAGSYSSAVMLSNPANQFSGSFEGDGEGLTNLNAGNLTGTLPDERLSPNVALLSGAPVFTGSIRSGGDLAGVRLNVGTGHLLVGALGTIAGGEANTNEGAWATIAGGHFNVADGVNSSVGGGLQNTASGPASTVPGGENNLAAGSFSFAAGRRAKANHDGTFVWADSTDADFSSATSNQFLIRAVAGVAINTNDPGGKTLMINGPVGITGSNALEFGADVPGKHSNAGKIGYQTLSPDALDVVGAGSNAASRKIKFWSEGGATFTGTGTNALVTLNNALDEPVSLALAAPYSTWRIGQNKPPDAPAAFDSFFVYQQTAGATRLLITDTGRVGIGTNNPGYPLHLGNGAYCTEGGVWSSVSDRNAKEDFRPVEPQEVLARVASLPITQWKYKVEPDGVKHLGPTAQDFHAAFGLGESDRAIGSVDADGVALAAIQGLNEIVRERDFEIRALKIKNQEMEQRLKALETLINRQALRHDRDSR